MHVICLCAKPNVPTTLQLWCSEREEKKDRREGERKGDKHVCLACLSVCQAKSPYPVWLSIGCRIVTVDRPRGILETARDRERKVGTDTAVAKQKQASVCEAKASTMYKHGQLPPNSDLVGGRR